MDLQVFLQDAQAELVTHAVAALKKHAFANRHALPPFRYPSIAQQIVTTLVASADMPLVDQQDSPAPQKVRALGAELGKAGLSVESALGVFAAFVEYAVARQAASHVFAGLYAFCAAFVNALAKTERTETQAARDGMQQALESLLRSREEELRTLVQELSTPLMPIREGVLAVPLIGRIDAERATRITECLLTGIVKERAHTVLIDLSGVPELNADIATGLLRMAQCAKLLGSKVVLTGMRKDLARTLSMLPIDLSNMVTLPTLRSGIEHAIFEEAQQSKGRARVPWRARNTQDESLKKDELP